MAKKKKIRVEFRKNRHKKPRDNDLTRKVQPQTDDAADLDSTERVRAKGDLSRHRTIVTEQGAAEAGVMPAIKEDWFPGRVLKVHGLYSTVELQDGRVFRCTVRRLLKSLMTEGRSIVTTGDLVWIRTSTSSESETLPEGVIERVEPRRGVLTRASRQREHVLVAHVDQVVIVMALVQPQLKPHLIDRYVATAEKGGLKPILCLNKIDLADPVEWQPLLGAYAQLGIPTLFTSAVTGQGIPRLRELLRDRATVFSGQSGVGKSSLLNAVESGLSLRVSHVSEETQKGRHTTTTAELIRLQAGGWVVDTPGIRQFQLWNTRSEEIEGYFAEFRPYVPHCAFPDCSHTHETGCAIQRAVARRLISERRYMSYLGLFNGLEEEA